MKRYQTYFLFLGLAALIACKKESNNPVASSPESNPYSRPDNASDEINHQIFLVYQQSQIPILYSDTLSKNPLKVVNLNYQLGGSPSTYSYTYPKAKTDILTGINFIKNSIIPPLGPKIKVYSISLLDNLKTVAYGVTTNYTVLPGLTTFGIANVPAISTMTAVQLKTYKAEILTNLLLNPLNTSGVLNGFYGVSASYYGRYVYGAVTDANYLQYKDKREYGFIPNGTESASSYSIGDQNADLKAYLGKLLTLTATEFQTQYGNYPLVMSKYNLLKTALTTVGFDLTKI